MHHTAHALVPRVEQGEHVGEDGRVLAAAGSDRHALAGLEQARGGDGLVHLVLQRGVEALAAQRLGRFWAF